MAEAGPFSHLTSLQSWVSLERGVAPSVPLQARHPPPFKTPKSPEGWVDRASGGGRLESQHPSPDTPHLPCSDRRLPLAAAPAFPSPRPCKPEAPRDGEWNGNAIAGAVPWLRGRKRGLRDPNPQPWDLEKWRATSCPRVGPSVQGLARANPNTSLAGSLPPPLHLPLPSMGAVLT